MASDVRVESAGEGQSNFQTPTRNGKLEIPPRMDQDDEEDDEDEDEDEEEEEEDEEPRLKYASLTKGQGSVYRNGDATSAFLVAGDKMIIGTHNGHIHVLSLPSFNSLKVYHAHSASITCVSVSPFPPPLPAARPEAVNRLVSEQQSASPRPTASTNGSASSKGKKQAPVPNIPSNAIHIATSSIDGNVCIASLIDPKDVLLRNFGRPVQSVALSPEYKSDRTYLSGGLAGNLVLTVGGRAGTSSNSTTTGTAVATASGWLGTIGLSGGNGTDTVLHRGEGSISTIKWSLTGRYVVWVNEHGIKIMRSNLDLDSGEADYAWKRMSHIDRPNRPGWEEMAGVWKARAEWIDEDGLEPDFDAANGQCATTTEPVPSETPSMLSLRKSQKIKKVEKLVVGWGGTIWIVNIHPGGVGKGVEAGEQTIGSVEVVTILTIFHDDESATTDCIISGITLYTPKLLVVLAYIIPPEGKEEDLKSNTTSPRRGVSRRQNALRPEIKIIDITTKREICEPDTLHVSRYESLSATDYHLGVLPVIRSTTKVMNQRGAMELIGSIGGGIWDASMYPARLFRSGDSIRSNGGQSDSKSDGKATRSALSDEFSAPQENKAPHPSLLTRGMKIFIQSPYDCVLATKPTLSDSLAWLKDHQKYEEAWNLLDRHPDAATGKQENLSDSTPSTPTKGAGSLQEFFEDDTSQATTTEGGNFNSQAEKEKRHVGEKWIRQLITIEEWSKAGELCSKVLGASASWEHWVWVFAEAKKFDDMAPYIPTTQMRPPISSTVYEVMLGHYISHDRTRLRDLLARWPPELYDVGSIITAIEGKLKIGNISETSVEDGKQGRDWRILMDCLAKLYLDNGRARDALKCYIKIQDAESALALIGSHHLVDALSDDIPGLILLRISKDQQKNASLSELEELSREPIRLLISEAHHGIVQPDAVISQLSKDSLKPFLFFYLRDLWNGELPSTPTKASHAVAAHLATEGRALVNDHADKALYIFAEYDRSLLFNFLKSSQSYDLSKASALCEEKAFIPEHVYILAKEGRIRQALFVIIEKLGDVSQAIAFAKEQDDKELWNDLLEYSMNKPTFVRALLEEVGTSIDPIDLVRRIPEGLEIEGLRQSLSRMIKEYELQDSISDGVARVLRGEVATSMNILRDGQKRGIKFDVVSGVVPVKQDGEMDAKKQQALRAKPGYCSGCGDLFFEDEKQPLIAFPCAHAFHLACLMTYSTDIRVDTTTIAPYEEERETWERVKDQDRGVGPKVRHAKKLRLGVRNGCPVTPAGHRA